MWVASLQADPRDKFSSCLPISHLMRIMNQGCGYKISIFLNFQWFFSSFSSPDEKNESGLRLRNFKFSQFSLTFLLFSHLMRMIYNFSTSWILHFFSIFNGFHLFFWPDEKNESTKFQSTTFFPKELQICSILSKTCLFQFKLPVDRQISQNKAQITKNHVLFQDSMKWFYQQDKARLKHRSGKSEQNAKNEML